MKKVLNIVLIFIGLIMLQSEKAYAIEIYYLGEAYENETEFITNKDVNNSTYFASPSFFPYSYRITFIDKEGNRIGNTIDYYINGETQTSDYYFTKFKLQLSSSNSITERYNTIESGKNKTIKKVSLDFKDLLGNKIESNSDIKTELENRLTNNEEFLNQLLEYSKLSLDDIQEYLLSDNLYAIIEKLYKVNIKTHIITKTSKGALGQCDDVEASGRSACERAQIYSLSIEPKTYIGTGSEIATILDALSQGKDGIETSSSIDGSKPKFRLYNVIENYSDEGIYGLGNIIYKGTIKDFSTELILEKEKLNIANNIWGFKKIDNAGDKALADSNYKKVLINLQYPNYGYGVNLVKVSNQNITISPCSSKEDADDLVNKEKISVDFKNGICCYTNESDSEIASQLGLPICPSIEAPCNSSNINEKMAEYGIALKYESGSCCYVNASDKNTAAKYSLNKCASPSSHVYICKLDSYSNTCNSNNEINLNTASTCSCSGTATDLSNCIYKNETYKNGDAYCYDQISIKMDTFLQEFSTVAAGRYIPITQYPSISITRVCYSDKKIETNPNSDIDELDMTFETLGNSYTLKSTKNIIEGYSSSGKNKLDEKYYFHVSNIRITYKYESKYLNKWFKIETGLGSGITATQPTNSVDTGNNVNVVIPITEKEEIKNVTLKLNRTSYLESILSKIQMSYNIIHSIKERGTCKITSSSDFSDTIKKNFNTASNPTGNCTFTKRDGTKGNGTFKQINGKAVCQYDCDDAPGIQNCNASNEVQQIYSYTATSKAIMSKNTCENYGGTLSPEDEILVFLKNSKTISNDLSCDKTYNVTNTDTPSIELGECNISTYKQLDRSYNFYKNECCPIGTIYNSTTKACTAQNQCTEANCKTEYNRDWNKSQGACCINEGEKYYSSAGQCCLPSNYDSKTGKCLNSIYNKLVFRPISLLNPFPGYLGTGRKTGSNWCSGIDCSTTNDTTKKYITNKNTEVYTMTPLYSITLTPSVIQEIRKYNDKHFYDDFNMTCLDNQTMCLSNFLRNDFNKIINKDKSTCAEITNSFNWHNCLGDRNY